jgi:S-(hydroxymethyl)mycothiol dehydrogenase
MAGYGDHEHRQGRAGRHRGLFAAAGNAAIHAAALVGARKVIAVDVDQRKLELARQFSLDLVDSSQVNPVSAIRELTGGFGADAFSRRSAAPR